MILIKIVMINRFDIFPNIISDKELNIKMTARRFMDDDNNEPSII